MYLRHKALVHPEEMIGIVATKLKQLDDVLHCDWRNLQRHGTVESAYCCTPCLCSLHTDSMLMKQHPGAKRIQYVSCKVQPSYGTAGSSNPLFLNIPAVVAELAG